MPTRAHRPAELEWKVFLGSDAIRRGLLTEHQLRSLAWRRLRTNVYADSRIEPTHGLSCKAVALRLPAGAAIAGPSAAYLLGDKHAADFKDDVHVAAPLTVRVSAQRGVRPRTTELGGSDIVLSDGIPCTTVNRTAWDVAARLPPTRAVSILDAMLARGVIERAELSTLLLRHGGAPGSLRAKRAFAMVDGAARAPVESHLRVRLMQGGVPRPALRHPIQLGTGSGVLELLIDMAWPEYEVAVEYQPYRFALLSAAGWLVVQAPPARARRDFPTVLREVRQALNRRGATMDPDGWS